MDFCFHKILQYTTTRPQPIFCTGPILPSSLPEPLSLTLPTVHVRQEAKFAYML